MKRLLSVLAALLIFCALPGFAETVLESTKTEMRQQKISEIGFKILNANKIDKRAIFYYLQSQKSPNAFANPIGKTVNVHAGIMSFAQTDDEIAAVIAHEIGHITEFNIGVLHTWAMQFDSKKYEFKADKTAVDLLVNAGYNPIALIVISNKFMPQYKIEWWFDTHPRTSKRLAAIYEYIYMKYPEYLANNQYKENVYYQNFLLTSKENRKKLETKVENPKTAPIFTRYK